MNIHEYQAKNILRKYGVAVPEGFAASTSVDAQKVSQQLDTKVFVVKSQIHAGGRGKGKFTKEVALNGKPHGGVVIVKSSKDVKIAADNMLCNTLITKQTGAEGKEVQKVYIEQGSNIEKEYYLGIIVDRQTSRVVFIASTEGGMEIEEVAEKSPEKIIKVSIDPATGLQPFHARKISFGLGFKGEQIKKCNKIISSLYKAFIELDASQIEINPLVLTAEGDILVLDAKVNFDDNAMFRHPDFADLRDENEEEPSELEASKHGLSYIKMDGNIGCMVNGAGLAMSTMDIIKLNGGEPANFLDVGGGATKEKVTTAFKIILSDSNVEGILVNIFGGIMRCDVIAEGVVAAAKELSLKVPLVVRLEGTNVDLGKKIMAESGLKIIPADDLGDAAVKIVKAVEENK